MSHSWDVGVVLHSSSGGNECLVVSSRQHHILCSTHHNTGTFAATYSAASLTRMARRRGPSRHRKPAFGSCRVHAPASPRCPQVVGAVAQAGCRTSPVLRSSCARGRLLQVGCGPPRRPRRPGAHQTAAQRTGKCCSRPGRSGHRRMRKRRL